MKKKNSYSQKLIKFFVILFFTCLYPFFSYAGSLTVQGCPDLDHCLFKKTLQRDFYKNNQFEIKSATIDNRSKHNYKTDAISLNYNDFIQLYDGKNLTYHYTDIIESGFTMNVGTEDFENPQTWTLPDFPFIDSDTGENTDLSQSEYSEFFPTATHLQFFDYHDDEETYSEFYEFSDEKIQVIGGVWETNWDNKVYFDSLQFVISLIPLDINLDFEKLDTISIADTTYNLNSHVYTTGYGTLVTPYGNFNALKVAVEYYEEIKINDVLVGWGDEFVYNFYCENGYKASVYLSEGSEITGNVNIDYVEVSYPENFNTVKEISQKSDFCYPNPATDILNFQEIGNYQIYNSIGVLVLNLKNVHNTDISNLNSGLYFVKSDKAKIQKIFIIH